MPPTPSDKNQQKTENNNDEDKKIEAEKNKTHEFCVYFCGGVCENDKILPEGIEKTFKSINTHYENESKKILESGVFNNNSLEKYCESVARYLRVTNLYSNGFCGLFAICTGDIENRNVVLCQNVIEYILKK